jgi:hypothetical protein
MHIHKRVISLFILLFSFSGPMYGQLRDPIPEPIIKRGLSVEIREIARLPDTSKLYPANQHRMGDASPMIPVGSFTCWTVTISHHCTSTSVRSSRSHTTMACRPALPDSSSIRNLLKTACSTQPM